MSKGNQHELQTILVCLTNSNNAERLTKIAVELARKFGCHLVGLHTMQSIEVYPGITIPISSNLEEAFAQAQREESELIEEQFNKHTRGESFVSKWRCVEARSITAADRIVEHARCADLVIIPQADLVHDRPDQTTLQKVVIESSGRPVLVIPSAGEFDHIGDNILIGWSATIESTRSVHDAIPFMQNSKKTNVFWISKAESEELFLTHSAREIATALYRHGVIVNVSHKSRSDLSIGDELLNEAARSGADLIISSAYGHSRIYDFMVGATTPHLMEHMTVPVIFSC